MPNTLCPCDSGKTFTQCCQPFLTNDEYPQTAETLMRSRYSAFVTQNDSYLLKTWHTSTRPHNISFDDKCKWLGLKVKRTKAGAKLDKFGWVEFVARFKVAGKAERIEELSYFLKTDDRWFYVTAEEARWDELS